MSSESPEGAQLTAIGGFHLVTADLPRLRRFYQETLGFAADGPEQAIARDELELLGLHGAGRRQALRLGEQVVAIDQFETMGRSYPEHCDAASLWFQHLALVVADMAEAYRRVRAVTPISEGGPQQLPASSGAVHAFKFRDADGHPLELLQFPADSRPPAWRGKTPAAGQIGLGIDHSAISVANADASSLFYRSLGLEPGNRTINQGPEQQRLDHLIGVEVSVVPMQPPLGTPHLELLGYRIPRGAAGPPLQANDIAATRIVWHGARAALLRDPDGHIRQIVSSTGASV
jgi:catechol 2,3-dioxygenase-like lactoylglutathione lyase family enzyme